MPDIVSAQSVVIHGVKIRRNICHEWYRIAVRAASEDIEMKNVMHNLIKVRRCDGQRVLEETVEIPGVSRQSLDKVSRGHLVFSPKLEKAGPMQAESTNQGVRRRM
jgi:hypothetical protein